MILLRVSHTDLHISPSVFLELSLDQPRQQNVTDSLNDTFLNLERQHGGPHKVQGKYLDSFQKLQTNVIESVLN